MTYPEPLVARVTGVSRGRIADARKSALSKGPDWTLDNATVAYSAAGLKKLLGALGLEAAALTWPAAQMAGNEAGDPTALAPKIAPSVEAAVERAGVAASSRALVRLRVVRLCRNPMILHCRGEEPGSPEVQVRVSRNENFIPGMRLNAREPAPGTIIWAFEGQCPRWKGRY